MDNRELSDRITRIETILEIPLKNLVARLEGIQELQLEAREAKEFRESFNKNVTDILNTRLNTIEFDEGVKKTVDKEIKHWLHTKEVQDEIRDLFKDEFKKVVLWLYVKLTLIAGGIATTVAASVIQGVTGGK